MNPINFIVEKIYNIDSSTLKKYSYIYIFVIFLIVGIIQFLFILSSNSIYKDGTKLLEKRSKITKIIGRKVEIEEIKNNFDNLIKNNLNFRLKDYLNSIITNNNLSANFAGGESISEQVIKTGYTEVSMSFEMLNLTTLQAVNFIKLIEDSPIVFIKEIDLQKLENKVIKLFIVIATIKITT